MKVSLWKSKIAWTLTVIFILIVAVPLVITILVFTNVMKEHNGYTHNGIELFHQDVIDKFATEFQIQGDEVVQNAKSGRHGLSIGAIEDAYKEETQKQHDIVTRTTLDIMKVSQGLNSSLTEQYIAKNKESLQDVNIGIRRIVDAKSNEDITIMKKEITDLLMETTEERMVRNLNDHCAYIETSIEKAKGIMNTFALISPIGELTPQELFLVMSKLRDMNEDIEQITFLGIGGNEIATSDTPPSTLRRQKISHAGMPYFEKAKVGEETILTEKYDDGNVYVRLTTPYKRGGNVKGVITTLLKVDYLFKTIERRTIRSPYIHLTVEDLTANKTLHDSGVQKSKVFTGISRKYRVLDTLNWRVETYADAEQFNKWVNSLITQLDTVNKQRKEQIQEAVGVAIQDSQRDFSNIASQYQTKNKNSLEKATTKLSRDLDKARDTGLQRYELTLQKGVEQFGQQLTDKTEETKNSMASWSQQELPRLEKTKNRELTQNSIYLVLVSCGAGITCALLVAYAFIKPILVLVKASKAVEQGDWNQRVNIQSFGEMGQLASQFNAMTKSLRETRDNLHSTEEQLVHSAQLASLGLIASGIAHELNQPVAIIRGLAQQSKGVDNVPEELSEDLVTIESQTMRMTKIINHLRTFSRKSQGEMEPVDPHEIVQNCFILIGVKMQMSKIDVQLRFLEEPVVVLGDKIELEQVFFNLITNAVDAMEGRNDAKITISSKIVRGRLHLEFADNGPGITQENIHNIFAPFFTTKEPGKGTGLGLSISLGIIKKHNGEIRVRNDRGAVFCIDLPLYTSETPANSTPLVMLKAA